MLRLGPMRQCLSRRFKMLPVAPRKGDGPPKGLDDGAETKDLRGHADVLLQPSHGPQSRRTDSC